MIAILREAISPEEICDFLGIDRLDIDSVFGPLERFLDSDAYLRLRKCRWFHPTFADFVLNTNIFPEKEQRRYHQIVVDYALRPLVRLEVYEVPDYCRDYLIWHCYPFSDRRTVLRLVRSQLLPVLCRMPIFPLSGLAMADLLTQAAVIRNPGEVLFYALLLYAHLSTPMNLIIFPEFQFDGTVPKQKKTLHEKLQTIKDRTSFLDFATTVIKEKKIKLTDLTYVARRLSFVLRNQFVDDEAAYKVCNEIYQSLPEELDQSWPKSAW